MNLEDNLNAVRQEFLSRMTRGNGALLREVEAFVTSRLGKMLRPQLTLLAADTLGQASSRRTLLLATAVEMLHNASLLHDDFLLAQVMRILHEVDEPDTTQRVYQTVEAMVEAELLAQEELPTTHYPLSTYLKIIDGKTAHLFATACALGNPDYEEFGLHYGRLFQLQDDIADGEANEHTDALVEQEKNILRAIKPSLTIPNLK